MTEVLETLLDRLQLVQRALGEGYQGEIALRTTVARACRAVPELKHALVNQKPTCEALFADLRAALHVAMERDSVRQFPTHDAEVNFVDRRYNSNFKSRQKPSYNKGRFFQQQFPTRARSTPGQIARIPPSNQFTRQPFKPYRTTAQSSQPKKCFVCKKEGCWSTNHSDEERNRARGQYLQACEDLRQHPVVEDEEFNQYILEYEGEDPLSTDQTHPKEPAEARRKRLGICALC